MDAKITDKFKEIYEPGHFKGDEEMQTKKRTFLLTFLSHDTVTEVCDFLKMDRTSPYGWAKHDEGFNQYFLQIKQEKKNELNDLARKGLKEKLIEKDVTLIKFTLNCLDPDFREKTENENTNKETVQYQIIREPTETKKEEKNDSTNSQTANLPTSPSTVTDNITPC